ASDLARLATGNTIVSSLFPSGTTVSSIGTSSFTASNNATGSQAAVVIPFTNSQWSSSDLVNNLNQILRQDVTGLGAAKTVSTRMTYDASGNLTSKTPTFAITGTLTSGSDNVTSVSA